ncbi:MAG TPA: hypothetical protein VFD13_04705 [Candidatus Kapabacteria bacterium]|nr:hypothetical protein [Candidatus Kapabacteria bacterium]
MRGWEPIDMQFADANHGMILADSIGGGGSPSPYHFSAVLRTKDGGNTWEFVTADSVGTGTHPLFQRISYHSFSMPTPADAYELNSGLYGHVFATHDSGSHWQDYNTPFIPGIGFAWFRMFATGTGRAIDVTRGSGVPVAKTLDSGRSFSGVGYNDPIDNRIRDAVFLDTLDFWVSYTDGEMLHSTDGGVSFCTDTTIPVCSDTILSSIDTIYVFTSRYLSGNLHFDTNQAILFGAITPTSDPERLYVLLNRSVLGDTVNFPPFHSDFAVDFLETTNGGMTWRSDSSFGSPRVHQLCAPSPNTLWAFVGGGSLFAYQDNISLGTDTLVYSPDDGKTWYRDSTSIPGMTPQMNWPDQNHGYITALRDSTLLIYRFVSDANVAPHTPEQALPSLHIMESPVSGILSFECDISETVTIAIMDVLGRIRLQTLRQVTAATPCELPVDNLSSGAYMLSVESSEGSSFERFIKE